MAEPHWAQGASLTPSPVIATISLAQGLDDADFCEGDIKDPDVRERAASASSDSALAGAGLCRLVSRHFGRGPMSSVRVAVAGHCGRR